MAEKNQDINEELIVVGDKVDLVVPSAQVYRAMIEDRIEDGPFLLAIPSRKGIPMSVQQDDVIYLVFYRDSGRYIAQMQVIGLERRGEIRYMWLLQKTRAQRNQRRGAYRLPVSLSVQIYEYDEDIERGLAGAESDEASAVSLEKADSRDLSITGIALITKKQYQIDDKCILVMKMQSSLTDIRSSRATVETQTIQTTATVKRSIPWRVSGKFNTGMHFFGMMQHTSEEIAQFVLAEQQRQMRMRRRS